MGYGLGLVKVPPGMDPEEAYRQYSEAEHNRLAEGGEDVSGPIDPKKEEFKRHLAEALTARRPSLKLAHPDFQGLARQYSIDAAEARRRFRELELDDEQYSVQVLLFDDTAAISLHYPGPKKCREAIHIIWDCLEVLEREGGFAAYDAQVGKVLNLETDFPLVLENACGIRRDS
jgi:hypothetical protein